MANLISSLSPKLRSALYLGSMLAIAVGYSVILKVAKSPNVSPEYRAYFLTQELRYWPGADGLNYDLGTVVEFNQSPPFVGRNWRRSEAWGLWSSSPQAKMLFHFVGRPTATNLTLTFNIVRGYTKASSQSVILRSNGEVVGNFIVAVDRPTTLETTIPTAHIDEQGMLSLDFSFPNCVSPLSLGLSTDYRCLAIGLSTMTITASPDGEE